MLNSPNLIVENIKGCSPLSETYIGANMIVRNNEKVVYVESLYPFSDSTTIKEVFIVGLCFNGKIRIAYNCNFYPFTLF